MTGDQTIIPTRISFCTLRSFHPDDREALARHGNNRAVWRNLTDHFPNPYTLEDADFFIGFATNGDERALHLAIDVCGEAVGSIGLSKGRNNRRFTASMGYWIGEQHWGRGLATAAVAAFTEHVFSSMDIRRIESTVLSWNDASARVLLKNQFELEGIQRQAMYKDGELADLLMFSKLSKSTTA